MRRWREFLDSLATPGGNLFLLMTLVCLTTAMCGYHFPKGEDAFWLVLGGALGLMKGGHKPEEERGRNTGD
jgi:hypothetical protein